MFFRYKSLFQKLLVVLLVFSLLPMVLSMALSLQTSSDALERRAVNQLQAVLSLKKHELALHFSAQSSAMKVLQRDPFIATAMTTLDGAFTSVGNTTENNFTWSMFAETHGERVRQIVEDLQWADLYLINADGWIIYTATQGADLGQNLNEGPMAVTNLGESFALMGEAGTEIVFSDITPYEPAEGKPVGFLLATIFKSNGVDVQGYLALQVSLDEVNDVMSQRDGMGETGETYIVGPDYRMRSDSVLSPESHSVQASFAGSIEQNGVKNEAVEAALKGQSGTIQTNDLQGERALTAYTDFDISGQTWALIAQINDSEAFADFYQMRRLFLIIFAVVAVIVVALGNWVARTISGPVAETATVAKAIADGDLSVKVAVTEKDEVGILQQSMADMVDNLHGIISQIAESADQQATAAEELASITQQTETAANEQQSATEIVAAAINEMSASINEVSQNTHSAADSSEQTREQMQASNEQVTVTVDEVQQLNASIQTTMASILDLEKGAESIGGILDVIKGIADQTNLLALNAAIEAARAGEQGRGFAVVADEVRTLAQNTQQSTAEIEEMIHELQKGSKESVSAMEQGSEKTTAIVERFSELAQALSDSVNSVNEITGMNQQIADSAQQQSQASAEITEKVHQIRDLSVETGSGASEIRRASDDLARLASELSAAVAKFKL